MFCIRNFSWKCQQLVFRLIRTNIFSPKVIFWEKSLQAICFLLYTKEKKYFNKELFLLSVFVLCTRFTMCFTRSDYLWEMSICLRICCSFVCVWQKVCGRAKTNRQNFIKLYMFQPYIAWNITSYHLIDSGAVSLYQNILRFINFDYICIKSSEILCAQFLLLDTKLIQFACACLGNFRESNTSESITKN